MFTFKNLIDKVDFELVWKEYIVFYTDMLHLREEYFGLYKFLLNKEPKENIEEMVIHIDRQDYEECIDEVDCQLKINDNVVDAIEYRVHGKNNSEEWNGNCDISGEKWANWLGYFIHDKTIKSLSIEQIVALCLYEITWHGLTENDVINWANNICTDS